MSRLPGSPDSWSFVGHLRDDFAFPITRGRVVGGSSAVNGAQFTRARQEDNDSWTAAGGQTWSYEAVLPHLKALENDLDFGATAAHGASGPIRVQRPVSVTSPRCPRHSSRPPPTRASPGIPT